VKAKKFSTHFTLEEVTSSKLVLSYHLVIAAESAEFFLITEFLWPYVTGSDIE
jgi:hypothetical protein